MENKDDYRYTRMILNILSFLFVCSLEALIYHSTLGNSSFLTELKSRQFGLSIEFFIIAYILFRVPGLRPCNWKEAIESISLLIFSSSIVVSISTIVMNLILFKFNTTILSHGVLLFLTGATGLILWATFFKIKANLQNHPN